MRTHHPPHALRTLGTDNAFDKQTGCGLSCLEVAANSYISVLGSPKYAAARLNFSQGFQGVASFAGPLIAARWFFQGKNATSLDTVQWCVSVSFL